MLFSTYSELFHRCLLVCLTLCLGLAPSGCSAPPRLVAFDNERARYFAKEIGSEVNRWRLEHHKTALVWTESLAVVAQSHSRDMVERRFFAHRDPDGRNVQERLWVAGLLFHHAGENLAQISPVTLHAEEIVEAWAASPGHRYHLLADNFRHTGIGVYWLPDICYVTQVFADLLDQP